MMRIRSFTFNALGEHSYAAWDEAAEGRGCALVDPGCGTEEELRELTAFLDGAGRTPEAILLTHAHFDHILGVCALRDRYGDVPVWMHPDERPVLEQAAAMAGMFRLAAPRTDFPTRDAPDGTLVTAGGVCYRAFATPGHSPGGVCWYAREQAVLFSGDTLFAGSIGRTDLPLGDYDRLIVSLMDGLMGLDGDVAVYPGHGPATDIATERTHNPFLQPFNEPGEDSFSFFQDFS